MSPGYIRMVVVVGSARVDRKETEKDRRTKNSRIISPSNTMDLVERANKSHIKMQAWMERINNRIIAKKKKHSVLRSEPVG